MTPEQKALLQSILAGGAQTSPGTDGVMRPVSPDAPPWERPSWVEPTMQADMRILGERVSGRTELAYQQGVLTPDEYSYIKSSANRDSELTRLERWLKYKEHRGGFWGSIENGIGLLETVTGYRFVMAAIDASTEEAKRKTGFSVGFSTSEFMDSFRSRQSISEVMEKQGADLGSGVPGFAAKMVFDVILDPGTWLSFGTTVGTRVAIKEGSKAADDVARSIAHNTGREVAGHGVRTLNRHGEAVVKLASRDYISYKADDIYKAFNVKEGELLPEHLKQFTDDVGMRSDLVEFAIERYELYASELLGIGPRNMGPHSAGVKKATDLMLMKRGPASMFRETQGMFTKEIGIPTEQLMNGAMKGVGEYVGFAENFVTESAASDAMKAAVRFTGFAASKTYGAAASIKGFFTAGIENLPFEQRIITQSISDDHQFQLAEAAGNIRRKLDGEVEFVDAAGVTQRRKITRDDRVTISHHLEDPDSHPIDEALKPTVDWVRSQFRSIASREQEAGLLFDDLEQYVTHIYGSRHAEKVDKILDWFQTQSQGSKINLKDAGIGVHNRFSLDRTIASLEDAISHFGREIVEVDIGNILYLRMQASQKLLAKKKVQNYLLSEYGIGGLVASIKMANNRYRKMGSLSNYVEGGLVRLGSPNPINDSTVQQLHDLAVAFAKQDTGKIGIRSGKLTKLKVPDARIYDDGAEAELVGKTPSAKQIEGRKKKLDDRLAERAAKSTTIKNSANKSRFDEVTRRMQERRDAIDEFEEDYAKSTYYQFVSNLEPDSDKFVKARIRKDRKWFQKESRPSSQQAKDWFTGKFSSENLNKIDYIAKQTFGKSMKDLRQGEGELLVQYLRAHMDADVLASLKKSPRWATFDRMSLITVKNGKFRRVKNLFKEDSVDYKESKRLVGRSLIPAGKESSFSLPEKYDIAKTVLRKRGQEINNDSLERVVDELEKAGRFKGLGRQDIAASEAKALRQRVAEYKTEIAQVRKVEDLMKELGLDVEGVADAFRQGDQDIIDNFDDFSPQTMATFFKSKKIEDVALQLTGKDSESIKTLKERMGGVVARIRSTNAERLKLMDDFTGTFALPESVLRAIDEAGGDAFDPTNGVHRFLKGWQNFQKFWKIPLTLPFPEHHARNALTSVGLTATHLGLRMLNPQNWKAAMNGAAHLLHMVNYDAFRAAEKRMPEAMARGIRGGFERTFKLWDEAVIDTPNGPIKVGDITREAVVRGVNHAFVHAELSDTPFARFESATNGMLIPMAKSAWRSAKGIAGKTVSTAEIGTDILFRLVMFTDAVKQGHTFDEAAEGVRRYLNDYGRLSAKEKIYARSLIPFYSWLSFSMERALKDAIEKPGMFVAPYKAVDIMSEPDPGYQPRYLEERIGITSEPNDFGFYKKLVGFGLNQDDALRTWMAMRDLGNVIGNVVMDIPGLGMAARAIVGDPKPIDAGDAPFRLLSNMDFVLKSAAEFVSGRELFSGAAIGSPGNEELLKTERSRFESGRGFSRLDNPTDLTEAVLGTALGGAWLKDWLNVKPDSRNPGEYKIDAFRRWILGQTPASRFISTYENHVKRKNPGDVSYTQTALDLLGMDIYYYNPSEQAYFRDRKRVEETAMLLEVAHALDHKLIPLVTKDDGMGALGASGYEDLKSQFEAYKAKKANASQ